MSSERERYAATEVAVVLSHFDLGVITAAQEFPRGSRRSPKMILRTDEGGYLLKRRAVGRDDPNRVAFSHELQEHFLVRRFPVPGVRKTRDGGEAALHYNGKVYELFEFVPGERYDESLEQTTHAGKALARFHHAVSDFQGQWIPPGMTFHDAGVVRNGLNSIPTTTSGHDSVLGHEAELLGIVQELHERYDEASERVSRRDLDKMPACIIHGDWHPGNMLFRNNRVAVVLDLDSARNAPRVIDTANGMLQFSVIRGSGDPAQWPAFFDEARMRRFVLGYQSVEKLTADELAVIPDLMIESLIAEAVVPIALTGSFGPLPGYGVLQMVRRKVRWLEGARSQIDEWLLN